MTTALETQIQRINELSRAARTGWLSLLFVLVFVAVTLAGIEHVDFYMPEKQTQLPLIGVSVPTMMFFALSPALVAALYANLHFHLLKLWHAVAPSQLPALIDGQPASDQLVASFIVDLALHLRKDEALRHRDLRMLTSVFTAGLVFALAPIIVGWAWWLSMRSLNEYLTIAACGLPFALILHVMISSALRVCLECNTQMRRLRRIAKGLGKVRSKRINRSTAWRLSALVMVLSILGWIRTEGSYPVWDAKEGWTGKTPFVWLLASPDLEGVEFVALPPTWRDRETSHREHRLAWCRANQLPLAFCPFGPHTDEDFSSNGTSLSSEPLQRQSLENAREDVKARWCNRTSENITTEECAALFAAVEREINADWERQRKLEIAALPRRDLKEYDLRGANLGFAVLTGLDLSAARLDGTHLNNAQIQGANLAGAQMRGAYLENAQMQGADLESAQMQRAYLLFAHLQGANLESAQMQGAYPANAQMQGARLNFAEMQGAILAGAQMQGASLAGARMQGANLDRAQMQGAILVGAQMRGANLSDADMQGANLAFAMMYGADLSYAKMQGANLDRAQLQGTGLSRAKLRGVNLFTTHMQGASFFGTFPEELGLEQFHINVLFADAGLELPDRFTRPDWPDLDLRGNEYHTEWAAWQALGPKGYVWADRRKYYTEDGKFSDLGPPPPAEGDWMEREIESSYPDPPSFSFIGDITIAPPPFL